MKHPWAGVVMVVVAAGLASAALGQERLPQQVAGTWKITRVLPARSGAACWSEKEAQPLVGSLLEYSQHPMRWQGGSVPLHGVTTRAVSSADLAEEAPTGSTTEVPGDSVLVAGPGRIIVSACGVYFEARRVAPRPPVITTANAAVSGGGKG